MCHPSSIPIFPEKSPPTIWNMNAVGDDAVSTSTSSPSCFTFTRVDFECAFAGVRKGVGKREQGTTCLKGGKMSKDYEPLSSR